MKSKKDVFAFEHFRTNLGRNYYEEDLQTDDQIEQLFDLAQILQCTFTELGWQYLFKKIGLKRLYYIDKESGWFDMNTIQEWIESIYYVAMICGYNPLNDSIGKYNDRVGVFVSNGVEQIIDWEIISQFTLLED